MQFRLVFGELNKSFIVNVDRGRVEENPVRGGRVFIVSFFSEKHPVYRGYLELGEDFLMLKKTPK